jgi:hypothetical protein
MDMDGSSAQEEAAMAQITKRHWKKVPDAHDYPAAADYLGLIMAPMLAEALVAELENVPLETHKAKDLLRGSQLPLLPATNFHVAKDLAKIEKGTKLSPVLVVRGDLTTGRPMTVADGYHRICASYHVDENADIPCRMGDLPSS